MPGLTNATSQQGLDLLFPTSAATDHIAYSANGTAESASLARTPIGATGWSPATAADPSVKANANALTSATATGAVTVTHFAIYSALTAGTQRTEWQAVASSKTLAIGDTVTWAAASCSITLT